jgi:hypothetical protein
VKASRLSRPQRKTGKASGFRSARQFPWTKEEDALLGKLTDRDVAEKLGTGPDQEIAARLNRTLIAVRFGRSKKGIRLWHGSCAGVIKSGCGLSSRNWGQECPQNPQAGKPALRLTVGSIPVDASGGFHAISALALAAGVTAVIFLIGTTPQNHRQRDC